MVLLDVFRKGDVFLDFAFEDIKFRYEKATGKVFARFYGHTEAEVPHSDRLFNDAISAGKLISRDEYYRD